MKLNIDNTAETTWEGPEGEEWEVRILFSYQPSEPMQTNPDHPMFGPGCDAGIVDMQVERNEPIYDVTNWVEYDGYTDSELKDLAAEIHELINQEFIDGMGEE